MIAVDRGLLGVSVVEACRPPVDWIESHRFSSSELAWFFAELKCGGDGPDRFEQALYYVSSDRIAVARARGVVA